MKARSYTKIKNADRCDGIQADAETGMNMRWMQTCRQPQDNNWYQVHTTQANKAVEEITKQPDNTLQTIIQHKRERRTDRRTKKAGGQATQPRTYRSNFTALRTPSTCCRLSVSARIWALSSDLRAREAQGAKRKARSAKRES